MQKLEIICANSQTLNFLKKDFETIVLDLLKEIHIDKELMEFRGMTYEEN
jgi:hypothetical protein